MTEEIHRFFRKLEGEAAELVKDRARTGFSSLAANFQKIFPTAKAGGEFITDRAVELFRRKPELIGHAGCRAGFGSVVVSRRNPEVNGSG